MATLEERIARLEAVTDNMRTDQKEMKVDIKGLVALANQTKGGWKTLMIVGGAGGVVGAFISKAAQWASFTHFLK